MSFFQLSPYQIYLVPSMLKSMADPKIREGMSSPDGVPVLVIRFETEFVPLGLFPRLLIRCLKGSPSGYHKIHKNYGCFYWDQEGLYLLKVASGLHSISCVVTREGGDER